MKRLTPKQTEAFTWFLFIVIVVAFVGVQLINIMTVEAKEITVTAQVINPCEEAGYVYVGTSY